MNITTTITQKGQITIPKFIRVSLSLSPSDRLILGVEGEKIIATPVENNFLGLYGSVKFKGEPVDFKKLRQRTVKAMAKNASQEGL